MKLRERIYEFIHKQPCGTEEVIDINEIHITKDFEVTIPKKWKMDKCRVFVKEKGYIDTPVTIEIRRNRKCLVDGYVRYLVCKEFGIDKISVKYIKE